MQTDRFTTRDGLTLYTRQWLAQGDPARGCVILAHGLGEHIERYGHVAGALSEAGYNVYGLDHRGHGRSEGKRVQVEDERHFINDLYQYYQRVREENPNSKIFMIGHSMGSVIALHFAYVYRDTLDGLIVTGTATDVASTVSPLMRGAANLMYRIAPHFPAQPALSDPTTLTSDEEFIAQWQDDPYVNKGSTPISIAKYILETGEMLQENAASLKLPVLIMHGEADVVTPVSGSQIMHERIGSQDKELVIWPGMQHEIMNERERAAVIEKIIEWLNQH